MAKTNIFVAGHQGMVGSAIVRQLKKDQSNVILTASRLELDLTNQAKVNKYFEKNKINEIYLAAAKVGGIYANNTYPADFIYQNLMIEANVINAAHANNIQKLLFLGSSCIYPKNAKQPMRESELLTGVLEQTNEPYAIAKIAGIKLCESYNRQYGRDYRSVMPTNLYGPGDNYHKENSHVIPALIRRFHEAKANNLPEVQAWGTGTPKREFLYVDDMAQASIHIMNTEKNKHDQLVDAENSHINIGSGNEISIKNLTEMIAKVVGYNGVIVWDKTKPDGTKRKLLDTTVLENFGWKAKVDLELGLNKTYSEYLKNLEARNE